MTQAEIATSIQKLQEWPRTWKGCTSQEVRQENVPQNFKNKEKIL